jgi:hypothetical protein
MVFSSRSLIQLYEVAVIDLLIGSRKYKIITVLLGKMGILD